MTILCTSERYAGVGHPTPPSVIILCAFGRLVYGVQSRAYKMMKVWQDAFFLLYYRFRIYWALSPIDHFFAPDFKVGGGLESLKKAFFGL